MSPSALLFIDASLAEELLSSWITRVARGNVMKNHTLSHLLWPGRNIWNRDPDWSADDDVVARMATETETTLKIARRTTLKDFEGLLFNSYRPNARTQWIRPVGVWHRRRLAPGLQLCPLCLQDDGAKPYFRRPWRLGFIALCSRHGRVLLEVCPSCSEPFNPHRVALGQAICTCWYCGFDFRRAPADLACPDAIGFQAWLQRVVEAGGANMGDYGWTHSLAIFAILHQVMRLVASGKAALGLRNALTRHGVDVAAIPASTNGRDVERLPPRERHDLLRASALLFERWPETLVEICREERIWGSALLRDMDDGVDVPFALADPVRRYLDRRSYVPNAEEIQAMRLYLRRQGKEPSGHALRRLTGIDSQAFVQTNLQKTSRPIRVCTTRQQTLPAANFGITTRRD